MDIDQRDIEKGALSEILPRFYPDSISYLSELNAYRMYAEVWSNKRGREGEKRSEIGHAGYLKTLEFGEKKKKRNSDKVRFDYFVVADSIDYKVKRDVLGEQKAFIQMGVSEANSIFKKMIKTKTSLIKDQSFSPESEFHSAGCLPATLELGLEQLDLSQDEKRKKYYFEISTNSNDIPNQYQQKLLLQVLGRDDIFKKLQLLYKAGRQKIRCLFENPDYVIKIIKTTGTSNTIPRLCVAWPFHEILVFDFAGKPEDYCEACLLGNLFKLTEGQAKSEGEPDEPQIDSYA